MNKREREIETRLAAATPGEWSWAGDELLAGDEFVLYSGVQNDIRIDNPADKDLIANTPSDLRYLLDTVRELREQVAALTLKQDAD